MRPSTASRRRLTESLLAALIFLGSLVLALGIPAMAWLLVDRFGDIAVLYWLGLLGCAPTMILWGLLLGRLNRVFVRVSAGTEQEEPPPSRGVLETSLTIAVIVAIVLLAVFLVLFPESGPDFKGFTPA